MRVIPVQPVEVTPDWLSAALRQSGAPDAVVCSVRAERMQSLTSTMHRLHLSYSGSHDALPRTLVWKQSSVDPAVRAAYGHYRGSAYEREVRFYREIAPTTLARVPRCYLADYEPATDEHVLLLEDLGPTHVAGDLGAPISPDQAALCLHELAQLHAARWGKPASVDAATSAASHRYFGESLAECRDFLINIVGATVFETLAGSAALFAAWSSRLNAGVRTVIHADAHPGNVLFPTGGGGRAALVDWQGWREGPPARDVGRSLVLMLSAEERRRSQRALIADYCAVLRAQGVDYESDRAYADYCLAGANQWIWAATFSRRRDAWDEQTRLAMPELIRRAAQAALDALTEGSE